jgi:DNA (cytosine-5)-methyltransferase 3A
MRVLSLFDGISCARVALQRANVPISSYYASEIDTNAIKVSTKNYPDIIRLGSVVGLVPPENIDLLIGGSPCQDLSISKKDRKGLDGERSGLFWEYVRIKKECNPKWFVLENVASMPKKDRDSITEAMGVEPVMFDASLVSAQSRKRLFWTNIPFTLPEDRGILLSHILEPEVDAKYDYAGKLGKAQGQRVYSPEGKSVTLSANGGGGGAKMGLYSVEQRIRKLTPIECERLQGLPDDYTSGVAMTQRYKCLGNAFNVDVVAHILFGLDKLMSVNSRCLASHHGGV